MLRQKRLVVVGLLLVMAVIGITACKDDTGSLTSPSSTSLDPTQAGNFWVGGGKDKYGIYVPEAKGSFQITVPTGAYLLTYTTTLGTFNIVFSSTNGAFFSIGLLPGDVLDGVTLVAGEIPTGVTAQSEEEGVSLFTWPGSAVEVDWSSVFVFVPGNQIMILVINGEVNPALTLESEEGELEISIEQEPMVVQETRFEINAQLTGTSDTCAAINPAGTITQVPRGSSKSFKFIPCDRDFDKEIDTVWINGIDVTGAVKILGNGEGHLVIHNIRENLILLADMPAVEPVVEPVVVVIP